MGKKMNILKKYRFYLLASLCACFVSAVSLAVIPFSDLDTAGVPRVLAYVSAAVFWAGLLAEIIFYILACRSCSSIEKILKQNGSKTLKNQRIGLITFFSCKEACVVDILCLVSFLMAVVMTIFNLNYSFLMAGIIVFIISFNLHCFFNGKNYKYIKLYKLYKEERRKDE